ncbi:hypothetical protein ACRRTK_017700 [Alexandromys fortis]
MWTEEEGPRQELDRAPQNAPSLPGPRAGCLVKDVAAHSGSGWRDFGRGVEASDRWLCGEGLSHYCVNEGLWLGIHFP